MTYNFDEIIDRKNTNALNTDGFRQYIFKDDGNMKFKYEDDEFVRMWVADMEFATPEIIREKIKERVDRKIFGYTMLFDPTYYETFHDWTLRRYDYTFKREELVLATGVVGALYDLAGFILNDDEKLLFVTPSYAYFKYAADFNEKAYVTSELKYVHGHYSMDFVELAEKAKDPSVKMVIFCNPHNPSGRVWTEEELKLAGDVFIKEDLWIISDEIHCDLLRKDQKHIPMAKLYPNYQKIVTCMAPSKTFNMAGMMISNIIIRDEKLRQTWIERVHGTVNPLSLTAAQAAYEYGEDWLNHLVDYLDDNFQFTKDYLNKHLPKAVFEISEATYLAWVNISEYVKNIEDIPMFFANEAGVLLEGSGMFVANDKGFIRLNLACPRATIIEGLKRISESLK